MGVQFKSPSNYRRIKAYEVWGLFKEKFPEVQEMPPLPPQFETFGLSSAPAFPFEFNLNLPALDRFWFMTKQGEQLLQFQADRLLHNWRKVGDQTNTYPRFERIIEQFRSDVTTLEMYFQQLGNERLFVTQCELSYVNHIHINGDPTEPFRPQEWLSTVAANQAPVDEFVSVIKRVVHDNDGKPFARLHRESATGSDRSGRKMLFLNLTVRGRPSVDSISSALEFINAARYIIAEEFLAVTTGQAHERWKRTQ